jgi:hypothetical protein
MRQLQRVASTHLDQPVKHHLLEAIFRGSEQRVHSAVSDCKTPVHVDGCQSGGEEESVEEPAAVEVELRASSLPTFLAATTLPPQAPALPP